MEPDFLRSAREHEHELTPRQREVLDLIVRGHTNPEIAERLGMSLDGAKWNVSEILGKLGLATREDAAQYWQLRNRPAARLGRLVRGLWAVPALKWAAGPALAVAVAVGVAVAAWPGGDRPRTLDAYGLQPFELEAELWDIDSAGNRQPRSRVTWWYQDPRHWRIEQQPAAGSVRATVVVEVADGTTRWWKVEEADRWYGEPLDDPDRSGPLQSLLGMLGPRYEPDLATLIANETEANGRHGASAEVLGTELILGRTVIVIESRRPATQSRTPVSDRPGLQLQVGRTMVWVDEDSRFVMRFAHEVPGFASGGEITRLEFREQDADDPRFRLPAGVAREIQPRAQGIPVEAVPPGGRYELGFIPAGYELFSRQAALPYESPKLTISLLATDARAASTYTEPSVVVHQVPAETATALPPDGEPLTLSNGMAATIRVEDGVLVLRFSDDDVLVEIWANRLSREELASFATTLKKQP